MTVGIQNALDIGQQHQFLGIQRRRQFTGSFVSIHVICCPRAIHAYWRHDRNESRFGNRSDHARINIGDFAHPANILPIDRLFPNPQQRTVAPGQPHGSTARPLNRFNNFPVDLAPEHHLHHVHRFIVGHPKTFNKSGFLAESLEGGSDLWATTVDHHRPQPDMLEQHDIHGKRCSDRIVRHRVPAVLDNDRLAEETPHIGQRLDENLCLFD